jgi:hypothetical protein
MIIVAQKMCNIKFVLVTFGYYTQFKVQASVVYACVSAAERPLEGLGSQDTFFDSDMMNNTQIRTIAYSGSALLLHLHTLEEFSIGLDPVQLPPVLCVNQ